MVEFINSGTALIVAVASLLAGFVALAEAIRRARERPDTSEAERNEKRKKMFVKTLLTISVILLLLGAGIDGC